MSDCVGNISFLVNLYPQVIYIGFTSHLINRVSSFDSEHLCKLILVIIFFWNIFLTNRSFGAYSAFSCTYLMMLWSIGFIKLAQETKKQSEFTNHDQKSQFQQVSMVDMVGHRVPTVPSTVSILSQFLNEINRTKSVQVCLLAVIMIPVRNNACHTLHFHIWIWLKQPVSCRYRHLC